MTTHIHTTAIIDPAAKISENVTIGPYCVVGPHVTIGDHVILKSHVVLDGRTTIGAHTIIHPFASIGGVNQDLKYKGEETSLEVGSHNTIREYVTMQIGTVQGGGVTRVGTHNLFMVAAHVAHDCDVGNHIVMANQATLAGHVTVGDHAIIGGLAAIHQFIRVGHHAIIGGVSRVVSDVIPYARVKCDDATLEGLNIIGLERSGVDKTQIKNMLRAYNDIFDDRHGTLRERVEQARVTYANDPYIMEIVQFMCASSKFPLCQPPKKAA